MDDPVFEGGTTALTPCTGLISAARHSVPRDLYYPRDTVKLSATPLFMEQKKKNFEKIRLVQGLNLEPYAEEPVAYSTKLGRF